MDLLVAPLDNSNPGRSQSGSAVTTTRTESAKVTKKQGFVTFVFFVTFVVRDQFVDVAL
jgi:hypothetical protein